MSCGLLSLIRDGVAVGTKLVGAVWDDFLAGFRDDFDARVARAEAGFAADGLAKAEEQEEVSEPPDEHFGPSLFTEKLLPYFSCLDEITAEEEATEDDDGCPICLYRPITETVYGWHCPKCESWDVAVGYTGPRDVFPVSSPGVDASAERGTARSGEFPPTPAPGARPTSPWDLQMAARLLLATPSDSFDKARREDLSKRLCIAADELRAKLQAPQK